MLKTVRCDVAIIGAGTAGLAARRAVAAEGALPLLINPGPGGTTCARCGCMPSKLLLAAARAARGASRAKVFGVQAAVEIDGRAVMRRVQAERDHFVAGVLSEVAAIPDRQKMKGWARFADTTTLTVDDHHRVVADAVVIATGARPVVPKALRDACKDRLLTHETVFDLADLPRALAVIGAGPLGLELAVAFARLGVRVAVFDEATAVGATHDPNITEAVVDALGQEVTLHLGVSVEAATNRAGDVLLRWTDADGEHRGAFSHVLDAAGRPPKLDDLDLNMSGLELDAHGVPRFDLATLRCGDSAVFIAGDANAARPVLHEAARQGETAGRNAARYPDVRHRDVPPPLSVVYTDPDIASVGVVWDADAAKGWVVGCSDDTGRARIEDRAAGVLRVYVDRSNRLLLGGELFGAGVEHLAQRLAAMVQQGLSVDQALDPVSYHPTLEEGLRSALRDARDQL